MYYKRMNDLLVALGESIKMQEAAGIEPVFKNGRDIHRICDIYIDIRGYYELPLFVLEGKPVFAGDWLYRVRRDGTSIPFKAYNHDISFCTLSWNPPQQKIVTVELPLEDAQIIANRAFLTVSDDAVHACKNALKKD